MSEIADSQYGSPFMLEESFEDVLAGDETPLSQCSTSKETEPSVEPELASKPRWEFRNFDLEAPRPKLATLQLYDSCQPVRSQDWSSLLGNPSQSRIDKRKEQNRMSQRKFRERKEESLRKAGDQVDRLQNMVRSLRERVDDLEAANSQLRGRLGAIADLAELQPDPLSSSCPSSLQLTDIEVLSNQQFIPFQAAIDDIELCITDAFSLTQ